MHWRGISILMLTIACDGCTVLGAGLGSQVERYETIPAGDVSRVHLGDRLEVRAHGSAEREGSPMPSTTRWKGTYDGFEDGMLVLRTDVRSVHIALPEIDEIRVLRGTEWLPGMIAGAVADASIIVLVAEMGPPSVGINVAH